MSKENEGNEIVGKGGTAYSVSMQALQKVEENSYQDPKARYFSVLRPIQVDSKNLPVNKVRSVFLDYLRNLYFNGKKPSTSSQDTAEEQNKFFNFLKEKGFSPLILGYAQDTTNLVASLGLMVKYKVNSNARLMDLDWPEPGAASAFVLGNGRVGVTGVVQGVPLKFDLSPTQGAGETSRNFNKRLNEYYRVNPTGKVEYQIPGETFVRATTHPEGGLEILSVRTSNQLIKKLFEYTPTRSRSADGDPDHDTLVFSPLTVYGLEIIDVTGAVNHENLKKAIDCAQVEEDAAKERLKDAHDKFESYAKDKDLGAILSLTMAHLISRDVEAEEDNPADLNVATLDTAMATAIFRDFPLVIEGGDIADCPELIDAIVWCGDPELSAAIKQALQPVIDKNPGRFDALLAVYGSSDSSEYHKNLKEKNYLGAYKAAEFLNEQIVGIYQHVTKEDEKTLIANHMSGIRKETEEAVNKGVITHKAAAETLHQVNLELANCVRCVAQPEGGFTPVSKREDWNKLGNEAMYATSSKKKLASRILLGVGVILGVGFLVGLGVVTAGIGPAVIAAVGAAVGTVVAPSIAASAVGLVAVSALGGALGFDQSSRKDVEACGKYIKGIEKNVNTLIETVQPSGQEADVTIESPETDPLLNKDEAKKSIKIGLGLSHGNNSLGLQTRRLSFWSQPVGKKPSSAQEVRLSSPMQIRLGVKE